MQPWIDTNGHNLSNPPSISWRPQTWLQPAGGVILPARILRQWNYSTWECHLAPVVINNTYMSQVVWRGRNHKNGGRRHLLSMTDTVFTWGLKEHLPFPDSVFESMWKICSCAREKSKSENLRDSFTWWDTLSSDLDHNKLPVWAAQMSH